MREYDNEVQKLKYDVLKIVAKYHLAGTLQQNRGLIPFEISPGPHQRIRCCVYHERVTTAERVQVAMGESKRLINVLDSACDQCNIQRYVVTEACRGCIAQRCMRSCPKSAIQMVQGRAHIDAGLCVECGKCQSACPYNAIADTMRPCKRDCPTGAIKIDERKKAVIDESLCIDCGACVYNCPFGAIQDTSQLLPVIDALKHRPGHVYAIVAPAFATQFRFVRLTQAVSAIKAIGFRDVVEAALGADLVALHESQELKEAMTEGTLLTSSCCPGFTAFIEKQHGDLLPHVSHSVSPMVAAARLIKHMDPSPATVVVFIGPCIAKKRERLAHPEVDYVLTFEELAALIDAHDMDLAAMADAPLNNASYYGRIFATSGGLSTAIGHTFKEGGHEGPVIAIGSGLDECNGLLRKASAAKRTNSPMPFDFIEGMACKGGCVKGPVTMHHGHKDTKAIEAYAHMAKEEGPQHAQQIAALAGLELEVLCKK